MTPDCAKNYKHRLIRFLIAIALTAGVILGCVQVREFTHPTPPEVSGEWAALIGDVRTFQRRLGFSDTKNFAGLTTDQQEFPFCGYAPRHVLPYSYEDPVIRWLKTDDEAECRAAAGGDSDVYFGATEAVGEVGTPVTPSMLTSRLDRFVYLVIHEDCHDQFELPYGVEEALCNVIAYHGMAAFASGKFRWYAVENRSIRRYTQDQIRLTQATIGYYGQVEALYARLQRKEIDLDTLLRERAAIYTRAEKTLAWRAESGELNNVSMANYMTYSRHFPYLESVHVALGRDLARTVAFFKQVDKAKPTPVAVMKQHRIKSRESVEFIRAYEDAVLETVAKTLSESRPAPK